MRTLILTAILSTCVSIQAFAQSEINPPAKHNKAIFIEGLGNGLGLTANFDMRFKKGVQDGFGFRAGIGGLHLGSADYDGGTIQNKLLTFPVTVNYLVGDKRSAIEAGIGITPIYATVDTYSPTKPKLVDESGWSSSGFLNLGYRLQPLNNGFMLRVDWTPAFNSTGFSPAWFGLSLGYGFK